MRTTNYEGSYVSPCLSDNARQWIEPRKPIKLGTVSALKEADMARDIGEWLEHLGLDEYAEAFAKNRIKFHHLADLSEDDLRELGVAARPQDAIASDRFSCR